VVTATVVLVAPMVIVFGGEAALGLVKFESAVVNTAVTLCVAFEVNAYVQSGATSTPWLNVSMHDVATPLS
jgi:hypothetical protein